MLTLENYKYLLERVGNIELCNRLLGAEKAANEMLRECEELLADTFPPDVHVHMHMKDCNAEVGQLAFSVSPREENAGRHRVNIVRVTVKLPPPVVTLAAKYSDDSIPAMFWTSVATPEPQC